MNNNEIITNSLEETQKITSLIASELKSGDILALSGDLGSGKTTFAQGLAKALGIKEKITSPTFNIIKTYSITNSKLKIKSFTHIDCYRLHTLKDALSIGIDEYLSKLDIINVIEWPEKIEKILPKNTIWIKFSHLDDNRRKISLYNLKSKITNQKKKCRLKTIIFDFDQVIGDSVRAGLRDYPTIARILKIRIPSPKEIRKSWDMPWTECLKEIWPREDTDLIKRTFGQNSDYIFPLIKGAKQTLKLLENKKIQFGILTSSDKKSMGYSLKRLHIDKFFDFIIAEEQNKIHKPNKRVFRPVLKYLQKNHIKLDESLYIGDSPRKDYIMAKKVGIPFLGVKTGYYSQKDFVRLGLTKNRIIKSIKELPEWLEKNYDIKY